jgi:protein-disulfide isomerase
VLTASAAILAITVVHREFFPARPTAAANASGPVTFDSTWRSLLVHAIPVGSGTAPVNLIEFVDFECPVCRGIHVTTMQTIQKRFGDRLTIWYVHFPIRGHRFARVAAQASECAAREKRFGAFVDVAFAKQDSLGLKSWNSYARDAGVTDTIAFGRCVAEARPADRIDSGYAAGMRIKISGTPTFILNGWRFPVPPSTEALSRAIDDVLAGRAVKAE